jgi:hypothetical protein
LLGEDLWRDEGHLVMRLRLSDAGPLAVDCMYMEGLRKAGRCIERARK